MNIHSAMRMGFGCSVVWAALALASPATAQTSFRPERSTMTGDIVYRSATMLVRSKDGITGTIHTSGLTPGFVYTAWFAIFNNPENCFTRPCTPNDIMNNPAVQGSLLGFGGQLADLDGTADFGETRAVGDATNAFFGPGLLNPKRAEIHLAVRSHGPASMDPAVFAEQLTTFNGNCPPNTCMTIQAAVHAPK
ncbi:MAG TPA: hypothetical protein VFT98_21895 [Myxococcota bacterium]|nr:hypothetical protein [Myxococcota bacterium]